MSESTTWTSDLRNAIDVWCSFLLRGSAATGRVSSRLILRKIESNQHLDRYRDAIAAASSSDLTSEGIRGAQAAYLASVQKLDRPIIGPVHCLTCMATAEPLIEAYTPEIDSLEERWGPRLSRHSIDPVGLAATMFLAAQRGGGLTRTLLNAPIRQSQKQVVLSQALFVLRRVEDRAINAKIKIEVVDVAAAEGEAESPDATAARQFEATLEKRGQAFVSSDTGSFERHSSQFADLDPVELAKVMQENAPEMSRWLSELLRLGFPIQTWTLDQQVTVAALQHGVEMSKDLDRVRSYFLDRRASGGRQQKLIVKRKLASDLRALPGHLRGQILRILSTYLLRLLPEDLLDDDH